MSDALKAREALQAALRQIDINVSIARRDHPEGPMVDSKRLNVDALPHSQEILAGHVKDRINEALTALSALDQPSGVRVKKLVWEKITSFISEHECYHARAGNMTYQAWTLKGASAWSHSLALGKFPTESLDAAQAAAQADFDTRILSALDLSAIGAEGWKPMDSAPKDGTEVIYLTSYGSRWIGNEPAGHARGIWRLVNGEWRGASSSSNDVAWHPLPAAPSPPEPRS